MAAKTWQGSVVDNLFSTGANWNGGTAPAAGDDVTFDGVFAVTGNNPCTWDATTNLNTVVVSSGYTGTITATAAVNVNSGATKSFTFNGTNTFNSNGQTVTVGTGGFDASGTATKTLIMGVSAWNVGGNFNISGTSLTVNYNTSTVTITGISTITTVSGNEFYALTVNDTSTKTLGSNITVNNTLTVNTTTATWAGAFTITAKGDVSIPNAYGTITPTLSFGGSSNQTWTGLNISFPIVINKSGGTLSVADGILYGFGNSQTFTYTAGTTSFAGTFGIRGNGTTTFNTGTMAFNGFTVGSFETPTVSLTGALNVGGSLTISAGTLSPGSQTITVVQNFTNNSIFTAGTGTVIFNGSTTLSGATTFNNFTINSGKTVGLISTQTFTVNGAFTTLGTSTLRTSIGGSRAFLPVNGSQSVTGVTATDIDSSGGSVKPIHNVGGVNSNDVSWDLGLATTAVSKRKLRTLLGVGI